MPGPPPNPNARRRNDKNGWRTLPAVCELPAPRWPLGVKPKGLTGLWRHLWGLPVAHIWHEQNAVRLVARYALLTLAFENDVAGLSALGEDEDGSRRVDLSKIPAELRQIEDRLLISPSTRLRARVLVADAPAQPAAAEGNVTRIDDYRDLGIA